MAGTGPIRVGVTADGAAGAEPAARAAGAQDLAAAVLLGPASALSPERAAAFGFAAGWVGGDGAVLLTERLSDERLGDVASRAVALWLHSCPAARPIDARSVLPAAPSAEGSLWTRLRAADGPGAVEILTWSGDGERLGAQVRELAPDAARPRPDAALETAMARIRGRVPFAELLSIAALPPFLEVLLAPRERARCARFGARRRRDFAAGRIALKLATRSVTTGEFAAIDTLAEDGVLALSPAGVGGASIAHDPELAIAVASARGVPGVDVEVVAPRLESAAALFTGAAERRLVESAAVGRLEALARIWTAKEACAKAWAMPLPELFEGCELVEIGPDSSVARLGGERVEILHARLGEHLVSLVERSP